MTIAHVIVFLLPCLLHSSRQSVLLGAQGSPTMDDLQALSDDALTAGNIYLQTAQNLASNEEAKEAIVANEAQMHAQLANEILEYDRHHTTDVGSIGGKTHMGLRSLGLPCPKCEHDYAAACPQGWSISRSPLGTDACTAMTSYYGPCPAFANLKNLEALDKEAFETRCLVCWPCKHNVTRSIDKTGPVALNAMGGLATSLATLPPGPKAGFHSGAVGYSNPQLNIKPPEEQTPDVMNALNALLKVEGDIHKKAAETFIGKQRELFAELKTRMRDAVETGLHSTTA